MMKKANPTILGRMRCECGEIMEVRQRSNGRKLLYTYCPVCKQDMRSGEQLQRFWRENMTPLGQDVPEHQKTQQNASSELPSGNGDTAKVQTPLEWQPESYSETKPKTESSPNETEHNGSGYTVVGAAVAVVLMFLGFKMKGASAA